MKLIFFMCFIAFHSLSWAARIKDIGFFRGVRENGLIGYGLVVGLSGTGDTKASTSSLKTAAQLLKHLGVDQNWNDLVPGSFAIVVVTGELPPFARNGDKMSVRVSTLGDAKSLAGGTLIKTPLLADDQKIYAQAKGSIFLGSASGAGTQTQTVSTISDGATIEREFTPRVMEKGQVSLALKEGDFVTSQRVTKAINQHFRGFYAHSTSLTEIKISVPEIYQEELISFLAQIESLEVQTDQKAKIVINEKTGTIVMGDEVKIDPIMISHGDLAISISSDSKNHSGATAVKGVKVSDLIEAISHLGGKPKDMIDILKTMHMAGAIHGNLEVH